MSRAPRTTTDHLRWLLLGLLLTAVLTTAVLSCVDIESILGAYPTTLAIALAAVVAVFPMRSTLVFCVALAPLLMIAACVLAIGIGGLSPGDAQWPISGLWAAFTLGWSPLSFVAIRRAWLWRRLSHPARMTRQFSIRALFVATTMVAVLAAVGRGMAALRGEHLWFGVGGLLTLAVAATAGGAFYWRARAKGRLQTDPGPDGSSGEKGVSYSSLESAASVPAGSKSNDAELIQ